MIIIALRSGQLIHLRSGPPGPKWSRPSREWKAGQLALEVLSLASRRQQQRQPLAGVSKLVVKERLAQPRPANILA